MRRHISYIVLHCTAGPQSQSVAEIQRYWRNTLGWKRPGYHHLITADGADNVLASPEDVTNGVAGYNANSLHISYTGGVGPDGRPVDNRTEAQRATMERLVRHYKIIYPTARIVGHRDFSPDKNRDGVIQPSEWIKACPSFSVTDWVRSLGIDRMADRLQVRRVVQTRSGGAVNVRTGPGTEWSVVTRLPHGTAVLVNGSVGGWTHIAAGDKTRGYVSSEFLA